MLQGLLQTLLNLFSMAGQQLFRLRVHRRHVARAIQRVLDRQGHRKLALFSLLRLDLHHAERLVFGVASGAHRDRLAHHVPQMGKDQTLARLIDLPRPIDATLGERLLGQINQLLMAMGNENLNQSLQVLGLFFLK